MNIHPIAAQLLLTVALGMHVDDDLFEQADMLTKDDLLNMPPALTDLLNMIFGSDQDDPATRKRLQVIVASGLVNLMTNAWPQERIPS